ncbi:MAG: cyclic lactone autoinducer peptide [Herbinix sp.]|nr:cyclic lactone autoinducer peptide [Herbinix sp.]
MKKLIYKIGGIVACLSLMVTVMNVNSSCMIFAHQPKLPKGAEKLRKF